MIYVPGILDYPASPIGELLNDEMSDFPLPVRRNTFHVPQCYIWSSPLIGWLVQAVQPSSDWVTQKSQHPLRLNVLKRVGEKININVDQG